MTTPLQVGSDVYTKQFKNRNINNDIAIFEIINIYLINIFIIYVQVMKYFLI